MRMIGHFIGGREVKGTSGRFADVFQPMTGEVQAQVALASKAELRAAVTAVPRATWTCDRDDCIALVDRLREIKGEPGLVLDKGLAA